MGSVLDELLMAIDGELIVDLTTRMVAFPTQNPPGREKPCANFIREILTGWGIEVELVAEPDPQRPQIVAWLRGEREGPTLVLNGHMDTVNEGDVTAWHHSPFAATRENGRLYGLGTADMKGSLAIAMVVLKTLKEAGRPRAGTIMFQAVMGEEMDEDGTRTLLKMGYTGDWAIVLEPTDLRIGPGTRGACWHDVVLHGPSLHCGLIPGGTADVMQAAATFGDAVSRLHERISKREHHLMASPACRITRMEAGTAHNATVGRCEMTVDRRMLADETFEDVTEELQAILEDIAREHAGVTYDIVFTGGNEPADTPLDNRLIGALGAGHRRVVGREAEIWGPPYGCDMRNFVCDAGIPTTNFGPGDYRVCHQPNEFVEIEDMATCARVLAVTALELLETRPA